MKVNTYKITFPNTLADPVEVKAERIATFIEPGTVLAEFYSGKELVAAFSGWASVTKAE